MEKCIFSFLILLIIGVTGCSSENNEVIDELKPNAADVYNVVIFTNEAPSIEYQNTVNEIEALWEDNINSFSYILLREREELKIDYENVFAIQDYLHIVVLDSEGIVFQTNKLEALQSFLGN